MLSRAKYQKVLLKYHSTKVPVLLTYLGPGESIDTHIVGVMLKKDEAPSATFGDLWRVPDTVI